MKIAQTLIIAAFVLAYTTIANAGKVYSKSGKAIAGYDTVAYFTQNKAVKGSSSHTHKWNGATWHFSSAKNLSLFKANPTKYAPQYGGYCAYAIAKGKAKSIDPAAWKIIDPIIQAWTDSGIAPPIDSYEKGSWGPNSADLLLSSKRRYWQHACAEH